MLWLKIGLNNNVQAGSIYPYKTSYAYVYSLTSLHKVKESNSLISITDHHNNGNQELRQYIMLIVYLSHRLCCSVV